MKWLVNGVPADRIAVSDRGLQYGDGLFETIAVRNGQPRFLERHLRRLRDGCRRLGMPMPNESALRQDIDTLRGAAITGTLKLIWTRGSGERGYRPPSAPAPTRITGFSDSPPPALPAQGVTVRYCSTPLGHSPVHAGLKTLGRLEQVIARAEWSDPAVFEGLMCDISGAVVCGTMTNLFVVHNQALATPLLDLCGVRGIMREVIIELAGDLDVPLTERRLDREDLHSADAVFLSNALLGLVPVAVLDGQQKHGSDLLRTLAAGLSRRGVEECRS